MSDNTEPAFPIAPISNPNGDWQWGTNGITKLEYFAAAALTGLLANPNHFSQKSVTTFLAIEHAEEMVRMLEAGRKQP